jgi:hypothetical protein
MWYCTHSKTPVPLHPQFSKIMNANLHSRFLSYAAPARGAADGSFFQNFLVDKFTPPQLFGYQLVAALRVLKPLSCKGYGRVTCTQTVTLSAPAFYTFIYSTTFPTNGTGKYPAVSITVTETFGDVGRLSASVPRLSASVPKPSASVPKPSASVLRLSASVLKPSASVPKPSASVPKPSASVPKLSASVPKLFYPIYNN